MAVVIQPIKLNGNNVTISLIDFSIRYKKRNYEFSNGGGSNTFFEYFCEMKKWNFSETKFMGI